MRLPLDVLRNPFGEVAEAVTEPSVDGVLEMRVRVDEPRHDHGVVVVGAHAQLSARADSGDQPVLDRHGARFDRRAVDGQHPVGGEDSVQGSVTLAASACTIRFSINTESQIDASKRKSSGMASMIVVNGSTPGSATATQATTK